MTREQAINVLKTHYHKNPRTSYGVMVKQATEMAIQALQEQKVGHWESVYMDTVCGKFEAENKVCSVCGHSEKYTIAPYCRWCGARMEGADNE